MKKILSVMAALAVLWCSPAQAGETVSYFDGETELEGYWSPSTCEKNEEKTPLVIIVHQWKGLGDYEKMRADMVAAQCYDAFALDMYGKGVRPETREEAGAQAGKYKGDPALSVGRMQAALKYAKERNAGLEGSDIAAMGYCFGGTMVLDLARSGEDIAGVVSFHGGLSSEKPATEDGTVKASVQVHHGAADPHVPPEQVDAFIKEMDAVNADWQLTHYADAVHAFTEKHAGDDPSKGAAYNEKADKRSWETTLVFLEELFAVKSD